MLSSVIRMTGLTTRAFPRVAFNFSKDNWKDRDEASQKVYISQAEKQTIKKLLKKVEAQQEDNENAHEEFERKLNVIMRRYKIDNPALASEIKELHKKLI